MMLSTPRGLCLAVFLSVAFSALFAALPPATPAEAADGDLVADWGGDGRWAVRDAVGFDIHSGLSLAVQPDESILLGGFARSTPDGAYNFAIVRMAADGSVDGTYADSGWIQEDFTPAGMTGAVCRDILLQPDGKLVAVGSANAAGVDYFALARYLGNGNLDTDFNGGASSDQGGAAGPAGGSGSEGLVVTDFRGTYGTHDIVRALGWAAARDEDGKIVLAGSATDSESGHAFALARYDTDGSLDATLAPLAGGRLISYFAAPFSDVSGRDLAVQLDGKIVVGGDCRADYSGTFRYVFALARFNVNGTKDAGFGAGGERITDFGTEALGWGLGDAFLTSLALQPDGKIVAGGRAVDGDGHDHFVLARYSTDGSLDETFGDDGMLHTDFDGGIIRGAALGQLRVQRDGKILAVGRATDSSFRIHYALARYNSDGSLDQGFGTGGKTTVPFTDLLMTNGGGNALAILPQGEALAAGYGGADSANPDYMTLIKFENTVAGRVPAELILD